MQEFYRLIKGELLKQKRSFLWPMVALTPLVGALLTFVNLLLRYDYLRSLAAYRDLNPWQLLLTQHHFLWAFLLSLTATVVAFHVYYLEYRCNSWKQTLALPVSRVKVYLSKWSLVYLLNLFMVAANGIGLVMVGRMLAFPVLPDMNLLLNYTLYQAVAIGGLTGVQSLLSANLHNAGVSLAIGFAGVASSLFFAQSEKWAKFIPYTHIIYTLPDPTVDNSIALNYGFTFGFILLVLGMIFFRRKDIT